MKIDVRVWGEPHGFELRQDELLDFNLSYPPGVIFRWNPTAVQLDDDHWDPRWEIWQPLASSEAVPESSDGYMQGIGWIRFSQSVQDARGRFHQVDHSILMGLEAADWWKHREWVHDHIVRPEEAEELAKHKQAREVAKAAANYYYGYDNPITGPYTRGSWRWRVR